MATVRLIGPGRAGKSVASALAAAGHDVVGFVSSQEDPSDAAAGVDVLILAVPDRRIAEVARRVRPVDSTAGPAFVRLTRARGSRPAREARLDAPPHPDADPDLGAARLAAGATFAVAGDPIATELARSMGGRTVVVRDENRAAYHAAAA